ncbi:MAG TPA: right-handed parallel beta-helix repeat-containing protein, partial [Caldilineaceae bacterium]|nr:right-handed parallel beta-helix repeat-containing protein [Caldilineaceae bacterium]
GMYLYNNITGSFGALTLQSNTAQINGGGLYADGVTLAFGAQSTVADNIAQTGNGGGLYSVNSALTFVQVSFARNTAKGDGGGLYASGGSLALANTSLVTLNQAQTGSGGGLYIGGGAAVLTGVTLHQNFAHLHGGGLYLTGAGGTSLLINGGSQVTGNLAGSGQGGGLYVAGAGADGPQVTIQASRLAGNQAQTGGGALYQTGGSLVVTDTAQLAANNTVTGGGGALAVISSTVTVDNSTVEGNTAFTDGGGLFAPGSAVRVANGATFSGNSVAVGRGGAIYVDGVRAELDNATLANNTAAAGGGGLYAATLFAGVANSEFTGNNAGAGPGGGAYFRADLVDLTGNTVQQNETAGNGGGFAFEQTPNGRIIGNRIAGNTVRQDVTETTAVLPQDVRHPVTGQIISINGVPQVAGTQVISRAVSEGNGAGLYFVGSSAILTGNIILGNSNAAGEGGGFYVTSSAITLTNNVVAQNSIAISDTFGAGLYILSSQVKLVHTTIADNRNTSPDADALGVGIYVTKGATETSAINMVNNIVAGHELGMMLLTGSRAAMSATLWNNTGGDWDGPGLYEPVQGNVRGDPRFLDPGNGDYHIARDSAAFDIGVASGVARDIEGVLRPRAFGSDAGAYEHFYPQGVYMKVTATPRFVGNGETISYQVQVVNHSPVVLNNVAVSFILPGQQTAVSITGGPCSGTSCSFGTLGVDQLVTINLQATASGTPPDGGFIEMETTVNVSSPNFAASDTQQKVITRLQRCRIQYQGADYPSLQAAVNAVNDFDDTPDTIRVAGYCGGGVVINKKLTLQGGWDFSMTTLNPSAFPTTLDSAGAGRVMEIRGDIAPTVENLILRNGSAAGTSDGPSGKAAGGVLFIKDAKATLRNIRVTGGNSPDYGGGVFVDKLTTPTLRDSIIEANSAGEGGGGLYANNSSPELINVIIRNNTAQAGGGLYLRKSEAKVINSTISNNRATGTARYLEVAGFNVRLSVGGGGGVNFDESKASITGSTLENNTAQAGGALFADNSPGSISSSIIRNNQATGSATIIPVIVLANTAGGGGAIYAQRSDLIIEYNQITHNTSAGDGGAIHIFNGSADAKINGNFFGFNQAAKGSAIYVHLKPDTFKIFVFPFTIPDFLMPILLGQPQPDPPKLVMQHNTFAHNGGSSVVHLYGESYAELVANIFAFNSGAGVRVETEVLPYVMMIPVPIIVVVPIPFPVFYVPKADLNYTLWYQNGSNTSASGVGASAPTANDLTGDPAFKDDGFHIKRISAAYNTGKNTGIAVDIDGQQRPQADIADMGADEYPAIGVRYVAPGGSDDGSNFCRNYLNPCATLQDAIDAAREGDLIKMAGGVYTIHDTRQGQKQLGFITKTVTIQGGYYRFTTDNDVTDGLYTDHDWEEPHPDVNPTILDEKRVDEDGKPIEVKPVLSGLQLKNGNAAGLRGPEGNLFDAGGAIYIDHAGAVITDVIIADSSADYGGGIYMISSTLELGEVTVRNNRANERGGGFYLDQSDEVTIANIVIEGNQAPRGAGLYLERSAATLRLNRINANGDSSATLAGGGLYLDASNANVISNTITANVAGNGAGLFVTGSEAQIQGNTVTDNKALLNQPGFGRGGGFYLETGPARITQNVVQSNQAIAGGGFFMDEADASVENNQVTENIANQSGGGFYLLNTSKSAIRGNTIRLNLANGTGENDGGGGFYLESSNALLGGNTVTNNRADDGGGAYLFSFSNAFIQKNSFRQNSALNDGGGLYLKLSNASLEENTITENTTVQGSGGGVYVKLSGARFTKNIVDANIAALHGGGLYLDESGAILQEDTARANRATDGGGLYIFRSNTASFDKVDIRNNQATRNGGGLYIRLSNIPLADHQIVENQAGSSGGGLYLDESTASLSRNILRGNRAGERGGGLAIVRRSHASLGSNALVDNQAGATGSGVYVAGSNPTLVHTTIARNNGGDGTGIAAEKLDNAPSTVTLINTILAGQTLAVRASQGNTVTLEATLWDNNQRNWALGAGAIITGAANLNFFGQANFQADGIHITKSSKAVGVGISTEVSRDIDGEGRPQGSGPELGADELLADCAAVASSNLEIVFNKVQLAIDAAQPGDEVRISGACAGAEVRAGLSQLAYINKNITVRGGYTPTNWLVSYPLTQPTFLDAMGLGRVIYVAAGFNPVIEHLNLANGDAKGMGGGPGGLDAGGIIYVRNANPTLRNLTVTGGNAYYGGGVFLQATSASLTSSTLEANKGIKGGAVFLRNSNAVLRDNTLLNNQADDGGGLFLSFSQPVLERNRIAQNVVIAAGGGLFLESSAATLRENQVTTNTAQAAGGIYVDGAAPQLIRNRISANTGQNAGGLYLSGSNALVDGNVLIANSAGIGGGLYIHGGTPELLNNVIAKNGSQVQAAALYALSASPRLRHNTLAANTGGDGSGLFVTDLGVSPSNLTLINNILVDHGTAITVTPGNKVTLQANLLHNNQREWGGAGVVEEQAGNVRAAPSFVDPSQDDYHLRNNSPARDLGIDAGVTVDFDGHTRPADNGFDIGADEFVFLGLAISLQTTPDPVVSGAPFEFVVRVINQGNVDIDATIVAQLPPEMTPTGTLTFTARIARGDDFIQTIQATVNPGFTGVLRPKVTVNTAQGISQEAAATITVQRPDHALQLVAEASPSPAPPGGQLTYQVRLTNIGNRPVHPTVEAILPALVSTADALTFNPQPLGPGDIWTKSLVGAVDPAATGQLVAVFRASSPEGAAAVYTVTVPVAAPSLLAAKRGTPAPALTGQTLTYTLVLTNAGNVDFTVAITDHPPVAGNGRPLIAPGAPQIWTGVQLPAGAVWRQTVVAVVEPGYSGPLNSSLEATTHTGLTATAVDTREATLSARGPTIRAIRSGNWNDPATWQPSRVPNPTDIALVPEGITLDVDGRSNNPIVLTGLINQGTLLLHCLEGQAMRLEISDTLENSGLIRGDDASQLGESGCSVEVQVGALLNNGVIRSGDGADGGNGVDAGDGGAMLVFGQNIVNNGQIIAGDGGNVPPPNTTGKGGAGGDALVVAGPPSPALLLNRGLIA